jgi:hypothetical protein
MLNKVLLDSLDHSDCIDDVLDEVGKSLKTVGIWANNKYSNVCNELDEANRIIQELKDELEGNVVGNYATTQTVEQYEYEIKGLETTIATNRDREMILIKDFNNLHVKHEELKYKCANTVPFSRYEAMLKDYINLVSKVKDGTALTYIMSLK